MEWYKLSLPTKTLYISSSFEKKLSSGAGDEFNLYTRLISQIPDLKVVRRTHSTPIHYTTKRGEVFNCNQYKNLSYKNIECFLSMVPNSKEMMIEYKSIRTINAASPSPYAAVRRWFESIYPEYRTNPVIYFIIEENPKEEKNGIINTEKAA